MKFWLPKINESIKSEGQGGILGNNCNLKQVLYVPELSDNLLSVNGIKENAGEVMFSKNKVVISKNNQTMREGKKRLNGLYLVN